MQTIYDVTHFHEGKVPMRRGCTRPDILLTIVSYLVQQRYENGQALPVTSGQTKLS